MFRLNMSYMHRKCEMLILYISQGSAATQLRCDGWINMFCWKFSALWNSEWILKIDQELTKLWP